MPYGYTQPSNWGAIRKRILIRDGHRCKCGTEGVNQVDHIVPVSQGGTHADDNLVAICDPCHRAKSEAERLAGIASRRARMTTKRKPEAHPGTLKHIER